MSVELNVTNTRGRAHARALIALVGFVLLFTLKVAAVRWLTLGSWSAVGTIADLLFVFVLVAVIDLFFSDMRFRALVITDVIFSAVLIAIAVFYSYYQLIPTRESLAALGQAASVGTSIAKRVDVRFALMLIDIPVLIWWEVRAGKLRIDPVTLLTAGAPVAPGARLPYVYQRRIVYVVAVIAGALLAFNVQQVRAIGPGGNAEAIARTRGLASFLAANALGPVTSDEEDDYIPPAERLQARLNKLSGLKDASVRDGFEPGSASGKNVIVIQCEALQTAAIGATVNGMEVTPNLNKLLRRSWYFPNHVSGVGLGTTSDAEFIVNTSLYPSRGKASALSYVDRELPSTPRMLRAQGYDAYTFHTNTAQFWNRTQLYPALGFNRYFDKAYFKDEDKIGFGASDEVLFRRTLEQLRKSRAAGKPFYAQLVTVSAHFPFVGVPQEERVLKVSSSPEYSGTLEGDYLTEQRYADKAIGELVAALEKEDLLDETVLVIYGDHFALPEPRNSKEERAIQALFEHPYTPVDRMMTPLIVRMPGQQEGQTVYDPVGQIDVLPTIADALGLDLSKTPHVGRSVFREAPRIFSAGGLFPSGSYVDGDVVYIPGADFASGTVWNISSRTAGDLSQADSEKYEQMLEVLRITEGYVRGLPKRAGYDAAAKLIIPKEQ